MKNFSDKKRILFFGDSLTFCYDAKENDRLDFRKRWTTLVENKFKDNFNFIVEGQGGRTLSQDDGLEGKNGLKAFTQALYSHVYLDYIFIMLGTNNLKEKFRTEARDVAQEFLKYEQMLKDFYKDWEILSEEKTRIVLITPPMLNERFISKESPFYGSQHISNALSQEYKIIAEKLSWDFLDASRITVSDIDGIHLGEEGNIELAKLIENYIFSQK